MKIILLQDVKNVGKKGQIIDASDGYARNFILPKKLGVEANSKNMNDLKLQNANAEKIAKEQLENAKEFAALMETKEVVVTMKAGEGGRAFGSVSSKEIAQAAKAGFAICTLGSRILRCETAPLCALSALMYAVGEF